MGSHLGRSLLWGPDRNQVQWLSGNERGLHLPKMCIVATLPIWFQSLMCVLSCDGASCEKSASDGGYASIYQYMITNAVLQLLLLPFGLLIVYPLLLQLGWNITSHSFLGYDLEYGRWVHAQRHFGRTICNAPRRANQVVAAALHCGVASAYGTWLLVRIVVGHLAGLAHSL